MPRPEPPPSATPPPPSLPPPATGEEAPSIGQAAPRPARWSAPWPGGAAPAAVDETEAPVVRRGWATRERPDPNAAAPDEPAAGPISAGAEAPASTDGEHESSPLGTEEAAEADLSEARIAIEEKLRKKRCDDAAALLQSLAQDVGGRPVAELALDAGDRCRGLGKANAALNCYLAASRADPVYETPLARLADICIDDQDIDLAVSYLERIARLMRLRSDNKGALRIYRKIATVAPYRDDILELLMRAQTTGRLDS